MKTMKGRVLVEIDSPNGTSELINSYDHINTGIVVANDALDSELKCGTKVLFGRNFIPIENKLATFSKDRQYYLMDLSNVYLELAEEDTCS